MNQQEFNALLLSHSTQLHDLAHRRLPILIGVLIK